MITEEIEKQNPEDVLKWMKHMEENSEAQKNYAKKQYTMSKISAICNICIAAIILISALILVPKMVHTISKIDGAIETIDTVMSDLQSITEELEDADISGMFDSVNTLVEDSQEGLNDALQKIDEIAIEDLNDAITDLKAVVEPLANLFGR